jgi:glucose-1-phosphate cytidylyltransferase
MKVVILAGGMGTRIAEETHLRPKPMVEIGGHPILWHILKIYSAQGFDEFVICLGYKGAAIKEFFANYALLMSDVTFDMKRNKMTVHESNAEPWTVTLVDTGATTGTGGRLKRVASYLGGERFMLAYGDGVANIDLHGLMSFHQAHGRLATVTATQPAGKLGAVSIGPNDAVTVFQEKPAGDGGWISCGFFVLEPGVLDYIEGDQTYFEAAPLERLARAGQLMAFRHSGYWQALETLRDRNRLEEQWATGSAPWKIWA